MMAERENRLTTEDLVSRQDEPAGEERREGTGDRRQAADGEQRQPLLPAEETQGLRSRWEEIQTGFVDEPRRAVEEADALVADLMQRLASTFSEERRTLEGQWDRGDDVSTEDLRVALQRYRTFFDRLLAT